MIQTSYKITYKCPADTTSRPATVVMSSEVGGEEPCVCVSDPWGNEAFIPLSIFAEVDTCMQEVVNEHIGRAKE